MGYPVALTVHVEDFAFVHQSIQHRSGDHWITHELAPLRDPFIGSQDDRRLLIKLVDEAEQRVRLLPGDWLETDLVYNDKIRLRDFFQTRSAL